MKRMAMITIALGGLLGACGDDPDNGSAAATIAPTTGNTVAGTAAFTKTDGQVSLTVTVTGAIAGVHGMHLHQEPLCTNNAMDAGGHWDGGAAAGDTTTHGLPDGASHHMGDLGNITIAADGTGTLTRANQEWRLGDGSDADVVGHSIVFHAVMDDGSMPSAGARQGCGIIE